MNKHPSLVIVPVQGGLLAFKEALDQPELPCIDFDAVVGVVIDSVSSKVEADGELLHLGAKLLRDEFFGGRTGPLLNPSDDIDFYESPEENIIGLEHVVDLTRQLGRQLKQEFEAYRLYQDGELGYEYHGILDEHSIVLRPTSRTRR